MKKKWTWILVYVIALVACMVCIYVVPSLAGLLENTYIVEHGSIEQSEDYKACVVRNETVYVAEKAASVNRLCKKDILVRSGTAVVELSGSGNEEQDAKYEQILSALGESKQSSSGAAGVAGYVSYSVDGTEAKLTYDNIFKLSESKIKEYQEASLAKTASGKCAKGEPIFKITENGDWWLVFFTDKEDAKNYTEGALLDVEINGELVPAYVDSVKNSKKGQSRIVLSCNTFVENYLTMRSADIKVVMASAEGLLVNNSSIVEKDGHKGVLIKDKLGKSVFKRIGILADNGEVSAVSEDVFMDEKGNFVETIDVYDEIVSSPSKSDIEDAK